MVDRTTNPKEETSSKPLTYPVNRRKLLVTTGASLTALSAGCTGGSNEGTPTQTTTAPPNPTTKTNTSASTSTPEPASLHTIQSEGSILVTVFLYGIENDAWGTSNVDLSFEAASYGKYSRQLVADLSEIGGMGPPTVVKLANSGEDLTMFSGALNLSVGMFAKKSSDIEDVQDLAGKQLAVPPKVSAATNAVKAMIQSQTGFDIMADTANTRPSEPPTLLPLLEDDDVDAVLLYSGDTISAAAKENMRMIFDPISFWKEQTGYVPQAANWTAYRPWLQDNADVALRYLDGWKRATELFTNNVGEAINNYGRLGGITSDAEAQVVTDWIESGRIIPPVEFSQSHVDNTWTLVEAINEYGTASFSGLPEKNAILTPTNELSSV